MVVPQTGWRQLVASRYGGSAKQEGFRRFIPDDRRIQSDWSIFICRNNQWCTFLERGCNVLKKDRWFYDSNISREARVTIHDPVPQSLMKEKNVYLIPATILGVSLIVAVALFSAAWKKSKQEGQTITVTGSAKKEIVSDLGTLRWTLSANGPTGEIAYKNLQGLKPILNQYLQSQGLDVKAVSLISVNTNRTTSIHAVRMAKRVRAVSLIIPRRIATASRWRMSSG
jgi:hypothetical protein